MQIQYLHGDNSSAQRAYSYRLVNPSRNTIETINKIRNGNYENIEPLEGFKFGGVGKMFKGISKSAGKIAKSAGKAAAKASKAAGKAAKKGQQAAAKQAKAASKAAAKASKAAGKAAKKGQQAAAKQAKAASKAAAKASKAAGNATKGASKGIAKAGKGIVKANRNLGKAIEKGISSTARAIGNMGEDVLELLQPQGITEEQEEPEEEEYEEEEFSEEETEEVTEDESEDEYEEEIPTKGIVHIKSDPDEYIVDSLQNLPTDFTPIDPGKGVIILDDQQTEVNYDENENYTEDEIMPSYEEEDIYLEGIGATAGGLLGMIGGPAGSSIGGIAGGLFDSSNAKKKASKTAKNAQMQNLAMSLLGKKPLAANTKKPPSKKAPIKNTIASSKAPTTNATKKQLAPTSLPPRPVNAPVSTRSANNSQVSFFEQYKKPLLIGTGVVVGTGLLIGIVKMASNGKR